jgi:hypothetical protein
MNADTPLVYEADKSSSLTSECTCQQLMPPRPRLYQRVPSYTLRLTWLGPLKLPPRLGLCGPSLEFADYLLPDVEDCDFGGCKR